MLNLTRREKNVIIFLVLLYIVGCMLFFGKEIFTDKKISSTERDSIIATFQKKVKSVDSTYFCKEEKDTNQVLNLVQKLVNINTSSEKELLRINGVGPVTAKKIIEYREKNGLFKSVEELKNIKGIGAKTLEKIKGEVTIE